MIPLYQMLTGQTQASAQNAPGFNMPRFTNPIQFFTYAMQVMRNPAAFVKQVIPEIPDQILNDPNQVLDYLKKTRGVTDTQIQQIAGSIPRF